MTNKNRKISYIAWGVAILFLAGIFAPSSFGIDGMDGGYAISFGLFFLLICAIVTAIVFGKNAVEQDRITTGKALLAHWHYDQKQWDNFVDQEKVSIKEEKLGLFYIIAGWAIFFGILFPIFDRENGIWVTYTMIGLIALIWIVMKISIYRGRKAIEKPADAYISRFGVYFAGVMFSWRMFGASLTKVRCIKTKKIEMIEFGYRSGRSYGNIRVLIPIDKINEAKKIVEALNKDIK